MPPVFDLEYYARLKPGPGTGPGRQLAFFFLMSIRDHATRWMLGPDPNPDVRGAECCYFPACGKYILVPPPVAVASCIAIFLQQFVGGNGPLIIQLHGQQLTAQVRIEPRDLTPQITVELPVVRSLQSPAADLLKSCATGGNSLLEFEWTEFEDESNRRRPRVRFQLSTKLDRSGSGSVLLGRQRMPFHPDMHPPTKFLMVVLLMCFRDGAKEVEFLPVGDKLWVRYVVESEWHNFQPVPGFVWPQLVGVLERHATLLRPEFSDFVTPAVGWLEIRCKQEWPINLAVFLDPREASPSLLLKSMWVKPKSDEPVKPPVDDDDGDEDMFGVEFSPDDQ